MSLPYAPCTWIFLTLHFSGYVKYWQMGLHRTKIFYITNKMTYWKYSLKFR